MKHFKLLNFILCVFMLTLLLPSMALAVKTKTLHVAYNGKNTDGKLVFVDYESTASFNLVLDPSDADVDIKVTSSDNKIAEAVFDGTDTIDITTYSKQGAATITVKDANSKLKTSFRIRVQKLTEDISFDGESSVYSGKNIRMETTVLPKEATNKSLIWRAYKDGCDPSGIHRIEDIPDTCEISHDVSISSNGVIVGKPVAEETTVVLVLCAADGGAECYYDDSFTVKPSAQKIVISQNGKDVTNSTIYMDYEETETLDYEVIPDTAETNLVFESSNTKVVDVSESGGSITVDSKTIKSSANVTVKDLLSGKSVSVRVVVQPLTKELEITSEDNVTEIFVGKSTQLIGRIIDPDPKTVQVNRNLIWAVYDSSCDPANVVECERSLAADVNANGVVTGKYLTEADTAEDVKVVLCAADGGAECVGYDLTIKPVAKSIKITYDDKEVLSSDILSVEAGDTLELTMERVPEEATETFNWKSSNPKIATVEDGTVTGISKGVVIITVSSDVTSLKKTIKVRVVGKSVAGIEIVLGSPVNLNDDDQLIDGKAQQLKAIIDPTDADIKTVKWSVACSDPADCPNGVPAKISDTGKVTAYHVNKVTLLEVTAEATDGSGVVDTYEILVAPKARALRILDEDTVATLVATGDPGHYHANDLTNKTAPIVKELNSTDKYIKLIALLEIGDELVETENVKWSSSNKKIAVVDSTGMVTFLRSGTVTITASTTDGSKLSRKATLIAKYLVEDIVITQAKDIHVLAAGKSLQLKATVLPSNANNKKVRWYSDNTHAATVNPTTGKVTAANVSDITSVNIYAVSTDVNSADQPVAVSEPYNITVYPVVNKVFIYDDSSNVLNGKTIVIDLEDGSFQLTADTLPVSAANEVVWSTSNKKVVTVDQTGLVTPMSNGKAIITARTADGSGKSAKVTIKVGVKAQGLELIIGANGSDTIDLTSGMSTKLIAQITPGKVSSKKIKWTVSNTAVIGKINENNATVSVKIRDVVERVCTDVTAVTMDGTALEDTVEICAIPKTKAVKIYDSSDKDLTGQTVYLDLGADLVVGTDITAVNYPDDANQACSWSTSAKKILSWDGEDTFTGNKVGTAVITAKATDGSGKSAKITVKVYDPAKSSAMALKDEIAADNGILIKDALPTESEDSIGSELNNENSFNVESTENGEFIEILDTDGDENSEIISNEDLAAEAIANGDIDTLVMLLLAEDSENTESASEGESAEEGASAVETEETLTEMDVIPEVDVQIGTVEDEVQSETNAADQPVDEITAEQQADEQTSAEDDAELTDGAASENDDVQPEQTEQEETLPEETQDESTVSAPAVEMISVDVADDLITVTLAETYTLESEKLSVLPEAADKNTLTFEVENESVAALQSDETAKIFEEGLKIKGLAEGETILVIKSGDVVKTIRIVVLPAVVETVPEVTETAETEEKVPEESFSFVIVDDVSQLFDDVSAENSEENAIQNAVLEENTSFSEETVDGDQLTDQIIEESAAESGEQE